MAWDKSLWKQLGYALSVAGMVSNIGLIGAWSSNAIVRLTSGELDFVITAQEAAWVISFQSIGAIFACIQIRLLMDRIGRRKSLLLHAIPHAAGWITIALSKSAYALYVGRFISGLGAGSTSVAVVLVSEMCDKNKRGPLTGLLGLLNIMGGIVGFAAGTFIDYYIAIYIYLAVTVCFHLIGFLVLPESPYWLHMVQRPKEAEKELKKLRPTFSEDEIREESQNMKTLVDHDMLNKSTFKELFTKVQYRKSIIIFTILKIFESSSGIGVIGAYVPTILIAAGLSFQVSGYINVAIGCALLVVLLFVPFAVGRFGRKPLLVFGFSGIAVGFFIIGIFFFLQDALQVDESITSTIFWLPILGMLFFIISFSFGLAPIIPAIDGEIFATNIKVPAFVFGNVASGLLSIVTIIFFQRTSEAISIYFPFWCFSVLLFGGILFTIFVIPETKGKTFDEIQVLINGKPKPAFI